MGDKSGIEWTDATWNPTYGCTKVSPACAYCYIERTPPYRMRGLKFEKGRIPIQLFPGRLDRPMRWTKPRRIFVDSLSDLFHEDVPDEFIDQVFAVMALSPQHTYQVLTKRPERMREYIGTGEERAVAIMDAIDAEDMLIAAREAYCRKHQSYDDGEAYTPDFVPGWPLPNVWLGVTVENQAMADLRIPVLLDTPSAVRFVSAEPLLGPIDFRHMDVEDRAPGMYVINALTGENTDMGRPALDVEKLDWIIVGGESAGPPHRSLVMPVNDGAGGTMYATRNGRYEWIRSVRDQCVGASVAFHFKQWGGPRPKAAGRDLDGRTWDEFPS